MASEPSTAGQVVFTGSELTSLVSHTQLVEMEAKFKLIGELKQDQSKIPKKGLERWLRS